MTGSGAKVLGHHHVLAVADVAESARWWIEVMGFELWMAPDGWKFVRRGNCAIMMGECPDAIPVKDLGDHQYFAYFELDDVDAYHAEIRDRCEGILFGPQDQPWGMREMHVRSPEGHRMIFAHDLERAG
ncbi:MAG: VOC family protein [Minwuia sp.]|uniref:VOC family protein n=1 Tax=Minwuia sp. TaxID=2493630 RepID=UPI003A88C41C